MVKSKRSIIHEIDAYIEGAGGEYSEWYVSIASDAEDRLFGGHNVKEKGDQWIFRQCISSADARDIESHFVIEMGTDGGTGEGGESSVMVYAYRKNEHTEP
jgi:hypothetical protein